MGYATTGAEGSVVSWGSANFYSALLAAIKPVGARITVTNRDNDITGLGVEQAVMLPGLSEWTASLSAFAFATPRLGNVGTVTFSAGGYAVHVQSWEVTFTALEHDVTEFASTPASGPTWMAFRPDGPVTVSGKLTCRADSATALVLPHQVGASLPTLTLVYGDEAVDDQIAGTALLKQLGASVQKGQLNMAEYSFDGSGSWTPAGTSSPLGSSAIGIPLWSQGGAAVGALVVATKTGSKTLSGADSFWKSITIRCAVGAPVELNVEVRGTSTLTMA